MQTIETSQTRKLSKQEYNRVYYQKNRERWAKQKKNQQDSDEPKIFEKLSHVTFPKILRSTDWFAVFRRLELFVLCSFVVIITSFLIREAADFYLDANEGAISAYLKAGVIEGIAVLFSFSRSNQTFLRWAQKVVVICMCGFTLWVMSGKLVKNAIGDTYRVQSTKQTLLQLESELTQKEQLREKFLARGWLRTTRRYEAGTDQIRNKIIATRQELSNMQSPQVILNSVSILILFRLLLVVANLIAIHRIVEQMGAQFKQKEVINHSEPLNFYLN